MMALCLAVAICLLALSLAAFFGPGMDRRRPAASYLNLSRAAGARTNRARREAEEALRRTGWRLASYAIVAGLVWLIASLLLAQPAPFVRP